MIRTRLLALLVALAAVPGLPLAEAGAPAPDRPDVCSGSAPIQVEDLRWGVACDLTGRLVVDGGIGVVVPPPGHGVGGSGAGRGGERSLSVTHTGGVVRAGSSAVEPPARTVPPPAGTASGCGDRTFRLEYGGKPWADTLRWTYHRASTPSAWTIGSAVTQIRRAGRSMAQGRTDCPVQGTPDASIAYDGTTLMNPSVRGTADRVTCGELDRTNVVGWGRMPGQLEGWTCYWWNAAGTMIATDMLLRDGDVLVKGVPEDCGGRLDLRSLVTHEWGHAFGLDHVAQRHSALVMPHLVETCSVSDRTLGLGDFLGLRELYGLR